MKKNLVLYPFLFAAFQLLFLFSHNIAELSVLNSHIFVRFFIPLFLMSCLIACLGWLFRFFMTDIHKVGLILLVMIFIFFSYGHFSHLYSRFIVETFGREVLFHIHSLMVGRNKVYVGACGMLLAGSVWMLVKYSAKSFLPVTRFLNIVSSVLLLLSSINVASYEFKRVFLPSHSLSSHSSPNVTGTVSGSPAILPDIYYIILDAYASNNTLKEFYQYENSAFLRQLEEKGFYIASQSRSNYAFTILSLASSFNMEYLNSLRSSLGATKDLAVPIRKLEHNAVVKFLKSQGYRFTHIRSGWIPVEYAQYIDTEIDCDRGIVKDAFMKLFFETTALKPFFRLFSPATFQEEDAQRERVLCQFSRIPHGDDGQAPQFVFAHIPAPHWPYVFGANGEKITNSERETLNKKQRYINQLKFINTKVLELVENILSRTESQPIILLQADHGSWNHENWQGAELYKTRMRIFNAYYLPDGGDAKLYDSITPVNSFRIIFNHYFGAQYEKLEDRSYYSWFDAPYDFLDVTDTLTP